MNLSDNIDTAPTIDATRLWSSLVETARFGATPRGGLRRLALSPEDGLVRDWLVAQARALGYETAVDEIGNMYVLRPGRDMARPPVAIGSHLDTQPAGGRFDGVLGVLAGLEIFRALDETGTATEAPLCLVNWTNEEGARFAPAEMGSQVYAGKMSLATAHAIRDADGVSVQEALAAIGYAGSEPVGARRFAALLELHIEQGPILERAGLQIGVVVAAKGINWFDGIVSGQADHAGTSPMNLRRDALMALAEFALDVEAIARAEAPEAVGTIGFAEVSPGSRNTVPGEIRFSLEFRHVDEGRLRDMGRRAGLAAERIASTRGCPIDLTPVWDKAPVQFAAANVAAIKHVLTVLGLPSLDMTSGAGHDACALASKVPSAMIFIPCKDGISHNEAESALPEDCAAGATVLMRAALRLAGPRT